MTRQQTDGRADDLRAAGNRVLVAGLDVAILGSQLDSRDAAVLQADDVAATRDTAECRILAGELRRRNLVPRTGGLLVLLQHLTDTRRAAVDHLALTGRGDQLAIHELSRELRLATTSELADVTGRTVVQLGTVQLTGAFATSESLAIVEARRDFARDLIERRALLDLVFSGQSGNADLGLLGDLAVVVVLRIELDLALRRTTLTGFIEHRLREHGHLRLIGAPVNTDGRRSGATGPQLFELLAEIALGAHLDGLRGQLLDLCALCGQSRTLRS